MGSSFSHFLSSDFYRCSGTSVDGAPIVLCTKMLRRLSANRRERTKKSCFTSERHRESLGRPFSGYKSPARRHQEDPLSVKAAIPAVFVIISLSITPIFRRG